MKRRMLIAIFSCISLLSFSNDKIGVNLSMSSGYRRITLDKSEFEKVGLGNIVNEGYGANYIQTGINTDVIYSVLSSNGLNLNVGAGAGIYLNANVGGSNISTAKNVNNRYLAYREIISSLDKNITQKKAEYKDKDYSFTVADEKAKIAEADNTKYTEKAKEIDKEYEELNVAFTKYGTDEGKVKLEAEIKSKDEEIAEVSKEIEGQIEEGLNLWIEIALGIKTQEEAEAESADLQKRQNESNAKLAKSQSEKEELEGYKIAIDKGRSVFTDKQKEKRENDANIEKSSALSKDYREQANKFNEEKTKVNSEIEVLNKEKKNKEEEFKDVSNESSIDYSNSKTSEKAKNILDNELVYGASLYGVLNVSKNISNDIDIYGNLRLGTVVESNPLYNLTKTLERDGDRVDGSRYSSYNEVSYFKLKPMVNLGIGAKYKNFNIGLESGYNTSLVNLTLGYRF